VWLDDGDTKRKKQNKTELQTYSGKTARRENLAYGIAPSEKTEKLLTLKENGGRGGED